ncbi:MAG: preprotein translocase subunit SecG [Candidatus Yanofskybacteria bacterium RIFCSPHIGHO2_01_FULL_44_17]|uniref:Protein-export membrane protein SecG n=1 Tax=Candidatus Yanofskybacteria bacterium RIFCSPHIGHO2_01_FULL_44_17 TaxID=1802668 RepID=A0A1F8EY40_9BACT|nr:MAG: preprotein translocase subunit SecG [Candidatus Yanofskybacteria bacterium RIFCSPHIGHO2_01_FULL_44_17]
MQMLTIIQLVLAVLVIVSILLQQRGSGLSGAFGGEGGVYSTRRGVEKILFRGTVVVAVLFFGVSIARLLL